MNIEKIMLNLAKMAVLSQEINLEIPEGKDKYLKHLALSMEELARFAAFMSTVLEEHND